MSHNQTEQSSRNKTPIQTILKESDYHLSLFKEDEIDNLHDRISIKTLRNKERPFVNCIVRNKDIQLKPEEVVRQLYGTRLIHHYGYPATRLAFEHPVNFGRQKKNADFVILDKDHPDSAYIIVELKNPKLKDEKISFAPTATPRGLQSASGQTGSKFHTTTAKIRITLKKSPIYPTLTKDLRISYPNISR